MSIANYKRGTPECNAYLKGFHKGCVHTLVEASRTLERALALPEARREKELASLVQHWASFEEPKK